MNSSEPPQRCEIQEAKPNFSISQHVKRPTAKDTVQQYQDLQDLEQNLEQQMGESVVSEYILMDAQLLQSPCTKPPQYDSSYYNDEEDSDSVYISEKQSSKKQQVCKQNSNKTKSNTKKFNVVENNQNMQQQEELNSNKTTSEMNALLNMRQIEMKKPIYLNVIIVGESGLGKSTFVDAFLSKRFQKNQVIRPSTQKITQNKGQRLEGNIDFNINMIDTPGYTQGTNLTVWYQEIRNYILDQFEKYNHLEMKMLERKMSHSDEEQIYFEDSRVHVCLYFLQGPRIKKTDMLIMKKLQKYVNIIPVLAKGDSFTTDEIRQIKKNVIQDAQKYNIQWFDIRNSLKKNPEYLKKITDGKFTALYQSLANNLQQLILGPNGPAPPFLMISSIKKIEIKPNIWVFGRNYKWGLCNIENPDHSDFNLLYSLLIGHLIQKEQQQRRQILSGTILTIGLAITSLIFYPIKSSVERKIK